MPRKGQTLWQHSPDTDDILEFVCTKGTFPAQYATKDGAVYRPRPWQIYETLEAAEAARVEARAKRLKGLEGMVRRKIGTVTDYLTQQHHDYQSLAETIRSLGGEPEPWPWPVEEK